MYGRPVYCFPTRRSSDLDGRAEVTTRSSPAGRRHRYPPGPAVAAPAITRMGEITNPEITGQWGAGATDLGRSEERRVGKEGRARGGRGYGEKKRRRR